MLKIQRASVYIKQLVYHVVQGGRCQLMKAPPLLAFMAEAISPNHIYLFFFLMVLGIKLRASHMVGKGSTPELCPQSHIHYL
jgi:hypothetical protein